MRKRIECEVMNWGFSFLSCPFSNLLTLILFQCYFPPLLLFLLTGLFKNKMPRSSQIQMTFSKRMGIFYLLSLCTPHVSVFPTASFFKPPWLLGFCRMWVLWTQIPAISILSVATRALCTGSLGILAGSNSLVSCWWTGARIFMLVGLSALLAVRYYVFWV